MRGIKQSKRYCAKAQIKEWGSDGRTCELWLYGQSHIRASRRVLDHEGGQGCCSGAEHLSNNKIRIP